MANPASRISLSAHYTSYVWLKNGLSYPQLSTQKGRLIHVLLRPVNALFKLKGGANIDTFLLQRHKIIDHQLQLLIKEQGISQILELGSGLSARGLRIACQYPHVQYIETDLPAMIAHKAQLLSKLNSPANLTLRPCSFIKLKNQPNIKTRLSELDPKQPTLIISEGLINYFSTHVLAQSLTDISKELAKFTHSFYLTDLYPDDINHPSYTQLKKAQTIVSKLTKSQWFLHYQTDSEITEAFHSAGFTSTEVINPKSLYNSVIEAQKAEPLVRVVLAKSD